MLEWIMALAQICNTVLAAGKTIQAILPASLSQRETELLQAAAQDGLFQLVEVECCRTVFAGGRLFSDDDPAVAAHFLDAFTSLCSRGLIVHHGEELFRLTGQGFDIARGLRKSPQ